MVDDSNSIVSQTVVIYLLTLTASLCKTHIPYKTHSPVFNKNTNEFSAFSKSDSGVNSARLVGGDIAPILLLVGFVWISRQNIENLESRSEWCRRVWCPLGNKTERFESLIASSDSWWERVERRGERDRVSQQ